MASLAPADAGLDGPCIYWRTDLMAAPPRTPAELLIASKELQEQGLVRLRRTSGRGRQYEGLAVCSECLRGFGGPVGGRRPAASRLDFHPGPQRPPASGFAPAGVSHVSFIVSEKGCDARVGADFRPKPESLQAFASWRGPAFMPNWPYAWKVAAETGQCRGRPGGDHNDGWRSRASSAGATQGKLAGLFGAARSAHPAEAVAVAGPHREQSQRRLARDGATRPRSPPCSTIRAACGPAPACPTCARPWRGGGLAADHPGLCQTQRILSATQRRDHGRTAPEVAMGRAGRSSGRCSTPVREAV